MTLRLLRQPDVREIPDPGELTDCKSVGQAVEDTAAAHLLYRGASEQGVGRIAEL